MEIPKLKDKLFKFWNESEEYFQKASDVNRELTNERKEMLKYISKEKKVLDIGCGTAENSIHISKIAKYVGIDISDIALKIAEKYKNDNVTLLKADISEIPFSDDSFDVIICTYSFEHFLEPEKILNEMLRVCKEKGKIIIISPSWDFPFSFPPSINFSSRSLLWKTNYIVTRIYKNIKSYLSPEKLYFEFVLEPEVFNGYKTDNDAVLILTVHEIVKYFHLKGCKVIYLRKYNELFQKNLKGILKLIITSVPFYKYACASLFIVVEK